MWHLWIDTGGTFTDCLGSSPEGGVARVKILSSSSLRGTFQKEASGCLVWRFPYRLPKDFPVGWPLRVQGMREGTPIRSFARISDDTYRVEVEGGRELPEQGTAEIQSPEEPPILGARILTGTPASHPLPDIDLRLGTTRGTNALLERKGARTLLITNEGLEDVLRIGTQQRSELFRPPVDRISLADQVLGYPVRQDARGQVIQAAGEEERERLAALCREWQPEAIAICFLHAYRDPACEEELADYLRSCGFDHLSLSSRLSPLMGFQARLETTVANAYLAPVMDRYLDRVEGALSSASRLTIMASSGGLVSRERFFPKDSLLSGPAGGVVGAAETARRAGFQKCLSFDMGGTSTDVARWDGSDTLTAETRVGEVRIQSPSIKMETVAAGGGSICWFDGERIRVGPESAGSFPGPACYGAGGPLTLTDIHVLTGRIDWKDFGLPIDREAAREALEAVCRAIREAGQDADPARVGEAFLQIANEAMAAAIRKISLREGADPVDYPLVAFGGAGGLHACALARLLGIRTVLFPARAGLLSAVGLSAAVPRQVVQRQVLRPWKVAKDELGSMFQSLRRDQRGGPSSESSDALSPTEFRVSLRLAGQESDLELLLPREDVSPEEVEELFWDTFTQIFGYRPRGRELELVRCQIHFSGKRRKGEAETFSEAPLGPADGKRYPLASLDPSLAVRGPAYFQDRTCSFFLEEDWQARAGSGGTLLCSRTDGGREPEAGEDDRLEALRVSLFTNRFRTVTEEMGEQLRRTALSTNIRERLDFSCAFLDRNGQLVVNAPHVPVHLGSLGLCVRETARQCPMEEGDVVVTNHPRFGGSHLPDITVISPVYHAGTLLGYVANRAHHAEMGGVSPGSMPPGARSLEEEGVILPPIYLYRGGEAFWDGLEKRLREASYPSRAVDENLADVMAQVAANRRGVRLLRQLADQFGEDSLNHYGAVLRRMASRAAERILRKWEGTSAGAEQFLDDGTRLRVAIGPTEAGGVRLDFSGSADVHPGNFNATPGIVRSVVLYVLCSLVEGDIPLNEGLLEPLEVVLPEGLLSPPFSMDGPNPAVVAGNVETSQRLADLLLSLLGEEACSQGTMNNLVFGGKGFRLYETIGGGCGARDGHRGASGQHSHMTNTAITDPEVLEWRYPVRLERFQLRRGSGGHGKWCGGDGLIRQIRFLEAATVSLLSQHRREGPYGCRGGGSGLPGNQFRLLRDGTETSLPGVVRCELQAGEGIRLETPGGGAWGHQSLMANG